MAHYAKIIGETVVQVNVVDEEFFEANPERYQGRLIQTSYNGSIRKNYAGIGYKYDEVRDAFIPPRPESGNWVLNEDTCLWEEITN